MKNKIILGDCIDILKQIPSKSIDMVLTDPPYIVDNHGGTNSPLAKRCAKVRDKIDDLTKDFDFESVSKELIRVCKFVNIVMFCSKQQVSRTMMFFENLGYMVNLLVLDKTNPAPLGNNKLVNNLEYIVVARESGAYFNNALPINKKRMSFYYATGVKNFHPCEKPINLICDLLNLFSKKDDTVLDCFSGSGTTAIACRRTKRNFICVEKNEEYYKISCERLATEQVKKRLF